jgi:hypothetical protein
MPTELDAFQSTESRAADGTIETEQRLPIRSPVVPFSAEGGRRLGESYWRESTRLSKGLVRAHEGPSGVDLRLLAFPLSLLLLGAPELTVESDRVTCQYSIVGGLLSRKPGGELSISQTALPNSELRVSVSGFFARRGLVYRVLQRRLHVAVSRRYFRRLVTSGAA